MDVAVARQRTPRSPTAPAAGCVVPANDRVEVRFPAAAERAGTARFQIGAASGACADAAEVELPVWTPATTEAFATYGEIDEGAVAQPVRRPRGVLPAVRRARDHDLARRRCRRSPTRCSTSSRTRSSATSRSRRACSRSRRCATCSPAFKAEGLPSPTSCSRPSTRDLEQLRALQNDDGGFGFWQRGERSWPYLTIHVAHALARAKDKGFAVPDETM